MALIYFNFSVFVKEITFVGLKNENKPLSLNRHRYTEVEYWATTQSLKANGWGAPANIWSNCDSEMWLLQESHNNQE